MERTHFTAKMAHFLTRFGIPETVPDVAAAEAEQREWLGKLWALVAGYGDEQTSAFDEAVDGFVSSHKGGRPTITAILSETRKGMGQRPLELDSRGNTVDRGDSDWSKIKEPSVAEMDRRRAFIAEPECRGLVGVAMKRYVYWRMQKADPAAAREQALSEHDRKAGIDRDQVRERLGDARAELDERAAIQEEGEDGG